MGFTPTRVGTAGDKIDSNTIKPVHPHASGDSELGEGTTGGIRGSPPREWGQPNTRWLTLG